MLAPEVVLKYIYLFERLYTSFEDYLLSFVIPIVSQLKYITRTLKVQAG
jgi:hypothetical protein